MSEQVGQQWDYVIVGGGSAGCVLANRLSADPATRVLLLEAGGEDKDPRIHIPAGTSRMPKQFDWAYPGAPDPSCDDKVHTWASGKVLGGSSSINMMLWVRGERSDFDTWRDLGCPGWGYDDVLPYFERSETWAGTPSRWRGNAGPVGVTELDLPLEVTDVFLEAAQQAGHPRNPDYNGERQQGVGPTQLNQKRGLRCSAAKAYLKPARKRSNLTVRTGALATRIHIEGGRATGIEYRHEGSAKFAGAKREVILSAGSLVSPKLLMLSGVGPADHLRELGIDVVVDRPEVGANLQEHAFALMSYRTDADTLAEEMKPLKMLKHGLNFVTRRKGALTASCAAIVFAQTDGEAPTETEIIMMPIGMQFGGQGGDGSHDIHEVKMMPHGMMLYPSFVHPKNRGTLRLASTDPDQVPVIEHELIGSGDLEALIAACRQARDILAQPAMQARNATEIMPGEAVQTDDEWRAYLKKMTFHPYHPVGTCRMGSDADAVVDPDLRVRGVEGLRVIDASVFPTITSGNTNAPTIMVAEKGADLVRSGA